MDDLEWICGAEKRGYSIANPGDVEDFSGYALSSYGALTSRAVFSHCLGGCLYIIRKGHSMRPTDLNH